MTENLRCRYDFKCLICSRYGDCSILKQLEETQKKRTEELIYFKCVNVNPEKSCNTCAQAKECYAERGMAFERKEKRKYGKRNVIINVFPDSSKIEVLHYKEPFLYLEEAENLEPVDREKLLKLNKDGIYEPVSDDFTIQALQRSIRSASKRSMDKFYGYAKSNDWQYFITLTFDSEKVDRYKDEAVKHLYSEFQEWCHRKSPDVKMLMVPERHKKENELHHKALHFHGLISGIDFNLELAKDAKTGEYLYSSLGTPLFTIKDWNHGMSTLAIIPQEDNYEKVVNYLQKYINKDSNIGYCQKRYYNTRNLNFKNKSLYMLSEDELQDTIQELGLEEIKDTDRMVVYRKKQE